MGSYSHLLLLLLFHHTPTPHTYLNVGRANYYRHGPKIQGLEILFRHVIDLFGVFKGKIEFNGGEKVILLRVRDVVRAAAVGVDCDAVFHQALKGLEAERLGPTVADECGGDVLFVLLDGWVGRWVMWLCLGRRESLHDAFTPFPSMHT